MVTAMHERANNEAAGGVAAVVHMCMMKKTKTLVLLVSGNVAALKARRKCSSLTCI